MNHLFFPIIVSTFTIAGCGSDDPSDLRGETFERNDDSAEQGSADATAREANEANASDTQSLPKSPVIEQQITKEEPVIQASPAPTPTMDPAANGDKNIVVFRITSGTGSDAWNSESTIVDVKIGQTLRFVNDDSITHRLHTNGAPCAHGATFAAGQSFDCKISAVFDATKTGPLYDHIVGESAEVWIRATR
jgi:hypothetical protein